MFFFCFAFVFSYKKHKDNQEIALFGSYFSSLDDSGSSISYNFAPKCPFPETFPASTKERRMIEMLSKSDFVDLTIKANFDIPKPKTSICKRKLTKKEVENFDFLVKNKYFVQEIIENYPFWIPVGEIRENKTFIFTHTKYTFYEYNKLITSAHANSSNPVQLHDDNEIEFTYSIEWKSRYNETINSCPLSYRKEKIKIRIETIVVICVSVMVSIFAYLKLVNLIGTKKSNNSGNDDIWEVDESNEGMNIIIKREVTRIPEKAGFVTAIIGSGIHILLSTCAFFVAGYFKVYYSIGYPTWIVYFSSYICSAPIVGYLSKSFANYYEIQSWILLCFVTVCCSFAPIIIATGISSFASGVNAEAVPEMKGALPIFGLVSLFYMTPLIYMGAYLGNFIPWLSSLSESAANKSINKKPWYLRWYIVGVIRSLIIFALIAPNYRIFIKMYSENQFEDAFFVLICILIIFVGVSASTGIFYVFLVFKNLAFPWHWSLIGSSVVSGLVFTLSFLYEVIFNCQSLFQSSLAFFISWGIVIGAFVSLSCAAITYVIVDFTLRELFSEDKVE